MIMFRLYIIYTRLDIVLREKGHKEANYGYNEFTIIT
jgi:hypothetical protein